MKLDLTRHRSNQTPLARFWKRVQKSDGCWEWAGGLNKGYGSLSIFGESRLAHRFSWQIHFGAIPDGLFVCHHCDNRKCVRPDHLFLGTWADNAADRESKGRGNQVCGVRHRCAKLNPERVAILRSGLKKGELVKYAREWGVKRGAAEKARDRVTWKSVTP